MRLAQRWTWALLATLIGLSIVFLVALPAWAGGGHHPDCERYPQKCDTTTTTPPTTTVSTSSTTTTLQETTSTQVDTTTTTFLSVVTSTVLSESTTTALATSLTSQPPSSTDPTVAPADAGAQLPNTGLSHNVWAGLTFAAFVLLTMGGMAVLAGRDDE